MRSRRARGSADRQVARSDFLPANRSWSWVLRRSPATPSAGRVGTLRSTAANSPPSSQRGSPGAEAWTPSMHSSTIGRWADVSSRSSPRSQPAAPLPGPPHQARSLPRSRPRATSPASSMASSRVLASRETPGSPSRADARPSRLRPEHRRLSRLSDRLGEGVWAYDSLAEGYLRAGPTGRRSEIIAPPSRRSSGTGAAKDGLKKNALEKLRALGAGRSEGGRSRSDP